MLSVGVYEPAGFKEKYCVFREVIYKLDFNFPVLVPEDNVWHVVLGNELLGSNSVPSVHEIFEFWNQILQLIKKLLWRVYA